MNAARFTEIHDSADPRLADYLNLPDRQLRHQAQGLFIAEGELVVRKLIESHYRVRSVLAAPSRLEPAPDWLDRLNSDVPVYVAPQALVSGIIGFPMHRGVLALGERDPAADWRAVAAQSTSLLLMEDLSNHDNVGGLFRNAAALGGPRCGVLLTERCADPLYRKAVRVSMGHVLAVPFARIPSCLAVLEDLARMGFSTIALTPGTGSVDIATFGRPAKVAVIVGTEGAGVLPDTARAAAHRVRIAMYPGVDSLNAYVAAGIAMHRLMGE